MRWFHFAVAECFKYVKKYKHFDIDEEIVDAMEVEWNEFREQYYKVVHVGNHFKQTQPPEGNLQSPHLTFS